MDPVDIRVFCSMPQVNLLLDVLRGVAFGAGMTAIMGTALVVLHLDRG